MIFIRLVQTYHLQWLQIYQNNEYHNLALKSMPSILPVEHLAKVVELEVLAISQRRIGPSPFQIRLEKCSRFLRGFKNCEVAVTTFRNCVGGRYFTSSSRGIGYSFQLAIIATRINLIVYDTATAQS